LTPAEQIEQAYQAYRELMVIKALAAEGSSRFVGGEGPLDAPLMLVGEAPGESEDMAGRPFVGKSGQLLRQLMNEAGIPPEACRITNIVKYRPPRNRTPYVYELQASRPCLMAEVLAVGPLAIVTLGIPALCGGFGMPVTTLHEKHGQRIPLRLSYSGDWKFSDPVLAGDPGGFSCDLIPLYHPSWVLRTGSHDMMLRDLKAI